MLEISFDNREQDFSFWQLNQFFQDVQMGYIIRTDDNKVSVIDSGGLADSFLLGEGVTMKILGVKNIDISTNFINNSSLVFKIESKSKSILFLGDLGVEGGKKILDKEPFKEELKSEYVQMAHHGQNGVDRSFYEAVGADYALWPTPKWLWNNNVDGKAVDSGKNNILIVRKWMEDLNIKRNFVAGLEGTIQID